MGTGRKEYTGTGQNREVNLKLYSGKRQGKDTDKIYCMVLGFLTYKIYDCL